MARTFPSLSVAFAVFTLALEAQGGPAMPLTRSQIHGKHCLDEQKLKIYLDQTLGAQLNPLGAEHQLALTACAPFITRPGLLFDFTNIQVGALNYLSPTYSHIGGFVTITPLSILQIRAEASALFMWSLPIDGAGYFRFSSYHDDARNEVRTPEKAEHATGHHLGLTTTLRGELPIMPGRKLLFSDAFLVEYWSVGEAPYWYNLRRDAMTQRQDIVLKNTGALLFESALNDNIALRVGMIDDLTSVPRADYVGNLVAGIVTMLIHRPGGAARNLQPFLRVGGYTHHAFRAGGANGLIGFNVVYDFGYSPP